MNYYYAIASLNFKEISKIPLNKAIRVVSDKPIGIAWCEKIFCTCWFRKGQNKGFYCDWDVI